MHKKRPCFHAKTGAFEISGKPKKLSGKWLAVRRVHNLRTGGEAYPRTYTTAARRVKFQQSRTKEIGSWV